MEKLKASAGSGKGKLSFVIIFALVLSTLVGSAIAAPTNSGAPPATGQWHSGKIAMVHPARISEFSGKVEVQPQGKGPWKAAKKNLPLSPEDRVRTGADALCRIAIGDLGAVEIGARSELRLGSLRQVREQTSVRDVVVLHLERGVSRQSFTARPGRAGEFRVASPLALAGVRGTAFEMALDDQVRNLGCSVLEGTVELTGTAAGQSWSRLVTAGQALQVAAEKLPDEAGPADPAVLKSIDGVKAAAQEEASLPVVPEAGEISLKIDPVELLFVTGGVEKSFENRSVTISGAKTPSQVTIAFAGTPAEKDVVLEVGKSFSFQRSFEAYPASIAAEGSVEKSGDKTVIRFKVLKVTYVEEAAMDVFSIPCVVTATPGGTVAFTLKVSPGEEVEVE